MDTKEKKVIQKTITELFELLQIDGTFDVVSENEGEINIVLDTKDTGIIIGYHGDTLESLQLVASLCVSKKLDRFVRVSIEVGDYKKNRTEWLKNLAQATKERVLSENTKIAIPQLKSWERRIVHMFLADDKEVVSQSEGIGRDRVLVVSPKS